MNQGNREAEETLSGLPTLPEVLEYLWEYYNQLSVTRQNFGWGPTALTYQEIAAWSKLRNVKLDPWELDALLMVDSVFLTVSAEAEAKRKAQNGN